jgi:hypothetical protein
MAGPHAAGYYLWDFDYLSTLQPDGRVVSEYNHIYLFFPGTNFRPTAAQIASAMGIVPGSPFFDDNNATCHKLHVKSGPVKTRAPYLCYLVEVGWATNAPLNAHTDTDPSTRRVIWSSAPQIQQRFVIRDNANNLIVNTAGQPFDGGIPVDVRLGTVHANRFVDADGYSLVSTLQYNGAVNSTTFLGGDPGTVQVDVETHEHYEGAYHYWEENWKFTWDPQGHQPKPASAGFYQRKQTGSNTLVRIQQDGKDVMEPEPLDSNGILVPIANRPASCAFVTVTYFSAKDLTAIGLTPPS